MARPMILIALAFAGLLVLAFLEGGWELGLRWLAWTKRHRDAKRRARLR